jgi:hypothetical protein
VNVTAVLLEALRHYLHNNHRPLSPTPSLGDSLRPRKLDSTDIIPVIVVIGWSLSAGLFKAYTLSLIEAL